MAFNKGMVLKHLWKSLNFRKVANHISIYQILIWLQNNCFFNFLYFYFSSK